MSQVVRIPPWHYVHILDTNSGVTRVENGPLVYTLQEHEKIQLSPERMVTIPPRNYCVISNPVLRNPETGEPLKDKHGNYRLSRGDEEIRFDDYFGGSPFPLFPGETVKAAVESLQVVKPQTALRLRCLRDFKTDDGEEHNAGDEWLFRGPGTYRPRVEVQVLAVINSTVIRPNEALKVRARQTCKDYQGQTRKAGEQWLVKHVGDYLPEVDETVVEIVRAAILTERKALHLKANRTFVDCFGTERKAGTEWLVTNKMTAAYIPDVHEELVGVVDIRVLNSRQFCVVLDPLGADGRNRFGQKDLRRGPCTFFLQPGERLESGIENVYVLDSDEALLLRAKESFEVAGELHKPGDRWMIFGPREYVPPVEVQVVEPRKKIPLDENEGIYVRDIKSGAVRAVTGQSYLLKAHEELWEKPLATVVERLLAESGLKQPRDKTRVVQFRAPHNSAVQIYDYKEKRSRVVFGPSLVMLGPDEEFSVLSLSGDKPKRPHVIKSLQLRLGPEFSSDYINVETSDHARLQLKLSYNWHFEVEKSSDDVSLFSVPDFCGDMCKAIASRVRGAVASCPFDTFHKKSARIIREAVFGVDEKGSIRASFKFPSNGLVITNIDIQAVEPVDQRTRDSLQKSVQLAIEITTAAQEAAAKHAAEQQQQQAKGELERQRIADEVRIEESRKELIRLQVESAHIEAAGQASAEAKAKAAIASIEGGTAVKQAELRSNASRVRSEIELELQKKRQLAEVEHQRLLNELDIAKNKELSEIEAQKFKDTVDSIGTDTLQQIARAGPEMQAKLLQGLGLKSVMISDGTTPLNLFDTARGMIAAAPGGAH